MPSNAEPVINLETATRQELIQHIEKLTIRCKELEEKLETTTSTSKTTNPSKSPSHPQQQPPTNQISDLKKVSSSNPSTNPNPSSTNPSNPNPNPTNPARSSRGRVDNEINLYDVQTAQKFPSVMDEIKRQRLLRFPLFQELQLSLDLQRQLVSKFVIVRHERNQHIIKKGQEAREMFFVWKGLVSVVAGEADETVISTLSEESFFGELGLMFDVKRTASVCVTSDECYLFKLEKTALEEFLSHYPQIKRKWTDASKNWSEWFQKLMYKTVEGGQEFGGEFVSAIGIKDLSKLTLFESADRDFLLDLSLQLKPLGLESEQVIIRSGEEAKEMFLILSGSVQILADGGDANVLATINAGSFFGEVGLLFKTKRTATVRTSGKTVLLQLSATDLNRVMEKYPKVAQNLKLAAEERFQLFQKRNAKSEIQNDLVFEVNQQNLAKVGIFAHCDRAVLDKIASMMTKTSYKAGQTIIQHNSHADEMFFLVHGQVVISSEFGEKIAEDREGSYFGEVGILNNIPRIACVKAKTDCITYVLTRAALLESLEKYPDVMLEVKRESEARLQNYLMRSILA